MDHLLLSINSTVSFMSVGQFIAPNQWTHSKRTIQGFELIIGNIGTLYIQEENNRFTVNPSDILLLFPGRVHFGYKVSNENDSFYWLHFDVKENFRISNFSLDIQTNASSFFINNTNLQDYIIIPQNLKLVEPAKIIMLIHQLLHVDKNSYYTTQINKYITKILLMELTNQYINCCLDSFSIISECKMAHILEWIKINAAKDLTIESIAQKFGYNKDYLSRCFKKDFGISIKKLITISRIDIIKKLLMDTNNSIKEISHESGFPDDNYMIKIFKKYEGITPSQYRSSYYKVNYNNE